MALYSQTIKNIVSGISQQPPILRLMEQLEGQENAMSTEVGGLQKRPPTLHIKTLLKSVLVPGIRPKIHIIRRDAQERYIVAFTGTDIHIWDMQGNKKVVNYSDSSAWYRNSNIPRVGIKAVTVADYTFIVNTSYTPSMQLGAVIYDAWESQGALVNIKSGQYGRTYKIIINGGEAASYTTPTGGNSEDVKQIDTNYITTQLSTQLRASGYNVTTGEGWIYITVTNSHITNIETKDGYNNTAMYGILKTVQKFTNLPATAPNGYVVEILGENGTSSDNYFVKYDATAKVWKETGKPGIASTIDGSGMPHVLIREADGTFTFKAADWAKREVGDDNSNPIPSFINTPINDVFFFRNRLGLLAGENVILSRSGEFFNFWMGSAVEVQDTDPIDIAGSHPTVAILNHAVAFAEELLLFSEAAQFVLKADGVLSPKNAHIDLVTEFECLSTVRPVGAGRRLYFPAERSLYTSIKEFYAVQDVSQVKNAQDITAHVPSYIPNSVHKIATNTTENLLLFMTTGEENAIYVYKYLFADEQRLQSAWSKWTFGTDVIIIGGDFIGSTLYLIIQRGQGLFLEKMAFTYNTKDKAEEPYRLFIDRKVISAPIPNANYDPIYDRTIFDIQGIYEEPLADATYCIADKQGYFKKFTLADMNNGKVTLQGNFAGQSLFVGQLYPYRITFSETMVKGVDTNGGVKADTEGRLQLKQFWVNYSESGSFEAIVEHFDKQKYRYAMTARVMGDISNKLNVMPTATGTFKFPVQSYSRNCSIAIESINPAPVALIGAGWLGSYTRRTQRIT